MAWLTNKLSYCCIYHGCQNSYVLLSDTILYNALILEIYNFVHQFTYWWDIFKVNLRLIEQCFSMDDTGRLKNVCYLNIFIQHTCNCLSSLSCFSWLQCAKKEPFVYYEFWVAPQLMWRMRFIVTPWSFHIDRRKPVIQQFTLAGFLKKKPWHVSKFWRRSEPWLITALS